MISKMIITRKIHDIEKTLIDKKEILERSKDQNDVLLALEVKDLISALNYTKSRLETIFEACKNVKLKEFKDAV
ncbi:MAG: hypothetical protein Wins2KO_04090 [Winogradskyella sp.]